NARAHGSVRASALPVARAPKSAARSNHRGGALGGGGAAPRPRQTPRNTASFDAALAGRSVGGSSRREPHPGKIPEAEVRAYYQAHREELREPERRRVLHIAVGDKELAKRLAAEAQGASGEKWAELAAKHSV